MTEHKTGVIPKLTVFLMIPFIAILIMSFVVPVHAEEFHGEFPISDETIMLHPDILKHTNVPTVLSIDEGTILNPDVAEPTLLPVVAVIEQTEEPTLVDRIVTLFAGLFNPPTQVDVEAVP